MVESAALKNCTSTLELTFENDRALLLHLLEEDFIEQNFFDEVDDPYSTLTPRQKATKLVKEIKRLVKLDPNHYYILMNYLRLHDRYKAAVAALHNKTTTQKNVSPLVHRNMGPISEEPVGEEPKPNPSKH